MLIRDGKSAPGLIDPPWGARRWCRRDARQIGAHSRGSNGRVKRVWGVQRLQRGWAVGFQASSRTPTGPYNLPGFGPSLHADLVLQGTPVACRAERRTLYCGWYGSAADGVLCTGVIFRWAPANPLPNILPTRPPRRVLGATWHAILLPYSVRK